MKSRKEPFVEKDSYVLLYVFNIALAIALLMSNVKSLYWYSWDSSLTLLINRVLKLHPHSAIGGGLVFFGFVALLSLVLLGVLQTLLEQSLLRKLLHFTAGPVGLLAAPVTWTVIMMVSQAELQRWIIFELILIVLWTSSLLVLRFPRWCNVLIVLLHFGFWARIFILEFRRIAILFPFFGAFLFSVWLSKRPSSADSPVPQITSDTRR
jgi:hypothetical protein